MCRLGAHTKEISDQLSVISKTGVRIREVLVHIFAGYDSESLAWANVVVMISRPTQFTSGCDMRDFRELQVWHKSHALTLEAYRATASFPKTERFGLVTQIRRCSASIAANIAEGCGRSNNGDFQRFLEIAAGSACETEYHFVLARDLKYLDERTFTGLSKAVTEVKRMLASLTRKVTVARYS
jgi:four helix bundle protein